jgi:hypothetical protein
MTVGTATTHEPNKQTLRRAMSAISAQDVDAIGTELHESVAFVRPFQADIADSDRAEYLQLLSTMFVMFEKLEPEFGHFA